MKILIIMPSFAGHEDEIRQSKNFFLDLITYDEKKLVKRKWYFLLLVPFILLLSSIGLVSYYKAMYYLRDYSLLNKYLTEKLSQRSSLNYQKVLWIKAAGVDISIIQSDGVAKHDRFLYLYDPISRYPSISKIIHAFHNVFTFDPKDSEKYNIKYLRMFRDKGPTKTRLNPKQKRFDIVYVGSFTIQRLISCFVFLAFLRGQTCEFVLANKHLPSWKVFGINLSNSNINRNDLVDFYQEGKIILELRDLDQSGASQRKNDSEMLGVAYLSLPCISYKTFLSYKNINETISNLVTQFSLESGCVHGSTQDENYLNVDAFLSQVIGVEA